MDFAQPPPNMAMPPPNLINPPMGQMQGFTNKPPFRPFVNVHKPLPGPLGNMTLEDFDGKRLRKSVMRKTVDYNSSIIKELENRVWQRDFRDRRALQPDAMYYPDLMPPPSYPDNPINCVTTRFVKTATNKMRCPIFCMAWTPEGRRLVTGASSGEFTLWNGLTFNFETILQAHDSPVRTMVWSHNDSWMITGDHSGYVKYWQSNMNNVKMFQAHKEALRGISFSPSDTKFVTCSDDGTLRIWDFFRHQEERVLRGHGADVKCVHWHPQKSLIISGSKDNQQPIKLWDPKTGQSLATLHAHKSTVMDLKWNENGNWLITASRDHLLKLFDLRNLSQEVQTFRGHKKEASSVAWHPIHEGLFCSGGSDGAIMFWHVGADKEVGAIEQAHDSIVWTLAWHPLGHILCSGSNDHTSKFWTRNRPGDQMRDKYNLNTLPAGIAGLEDIDMGEEPVSIIPGMGPEDKVEITSILTDENQAIPGLDLDGVVNEEKSKPKKVPFSKPIPRNFQAQWNETNDENAGGLNEVITQLVVENTPGAVPLNNIAPNALYIYDKVIPVEPGSKLQQALASGLDALNKLIASGEVEELYDVMPINDDDDIGEDSQNISSAGGDIDLRDRKDVDFRKDRSFKGPGASDSKDYDSRMSQGDEDLRYRDRDEDFRFRKDDEHYRKGPMIHEDKFRHDRRDDSYRRNEDFGRDDDYRRKDDFRREDNYRRKDDFRRDDDYFEDSPSKSGSWSRNGKFGSSFRGSRGKAPYNSSFGSKDFRKFGPSDSPEWDDAELFDDRSQDKWDNPSDDEWNDREDWDLDDEDLDSEDLLDDEDTWLDSPRFSRGRGRRDDRGRSRGGRSRGSRGRGGFGRGRGGDRGGRRGSRGGRRGGSRGRYS